MTQLQIFNLALGKLGEPAVASVGASTPAAGHCNTFYQICIDTLTRKYRWNFSREDRVVKAAFLNMGAVADDGNGVVKVTDTGHGMLTGDRVLVEGTGVDGGYQITKVDDDNFTLDGSVWSANVEVGTYHKAPRHTWEYKIAWPSDAIALRTVDGYEANKELPRKFVVQGRYIYTNTDSVDLVYSRQLTAGTDESVFDPVFTNLLACLLAREIALPITGAMSRRDDMQEIYASELQDALMSNAFERRDPNPNRGGSSSARTIRIIGEE